MCASHDLWQESSECLVFYGLPLPTRPTWYVLLYFALVAGSAFAGALCGGVLTTRDINPALANLIRCAVVVAGVVAVTHVFVHRDGLTWARYGVQSSNRVTARVFVGVSSGGLLVLAWAACVAVWAPFSWLPNDRFRWDAFVAVSLASVFMGVAEEVGYRSYRMDRLRSEHGVVAALLVPMAIFIGAHWVGGVPLVTAVLVVGSCAVLFGSLMLLTGSLLFVFAFHVANNWLQAALLRLGDGSVWRTAYVDAPSAPAAGVPIWACMAAINLAATGVALGLWRRRGHRRNLAP